MDPVEYQRGSHIVSTDRAKIDVDIVYNYLHNTAYWCVGRPREVVERSIAHSLCFGVYAGTEQAGFARVVTDYATFAWLCDVFVLEPHRGQSLGKWLIECVVAHPALQDLDLFILATTDAHDLYRRYGAFEVLQQPEKWMRRSGERV
jgi:GNAT superfamily N-acetyltransferase